MRRVEPKVFLIGETRIRHNGDYGLNAYLEHIGASEWHSDAPTEVEKIIEVYGRLCYRSFKPGLNPNVTKIREHNDEYLGNIKNVRHGSVVEHGFFNFIFSDVSRVFTHELVRHRVGRSYDDRDETKDLTEYILLAASMPNFTDDAAVSQESLRFVRFDNVGFWVPQIIKECPGAFRLWMEKIGLDEWYYKKIVEALDVEKMQNFHQKKRATSALRRLVGMGVATTVGWTTNARTVRHCIEVRTDPGAEEEIRLVFSQVARIVVKEYPNLFGDYEMESVDGLPWYKTKHSKI